MKLSIVVAVLCLCPDVLAQPDAPPPRAPPAAEPDVPDYQTPGHPTPGTPMPSPEPTPAPAPSPAMQAPPLEEVPVVRLPAGMPLPGQESGRIDEPSTDSDARKFARGVLWLPRAVVTTLLTPIRLGVVVGSKYEIGPRLHRWFYNDADTLGIYPALSFESGYGFRIGAQMIYRPTPEDRLRAFAGGNFTGDRTRFAASYEALDRLGGFLDLGIGAEYNKRPNDKFYGFGNTDSRDVVPPMPVDVTTTDVAFDAEYRSRLERANATGDLLVYRDFHTRATASIADCNRDPDDDGDEPSIFEIYEPMSLVGFDSYRYGYGELELYWDSRARMGPWDHPRVVSTGSFASLWAGRMVMEDLRDFWRYGVELQKFIRLDDGPRVLSARFHGEGINADLDEVPFTEVPPLGGPIYLRGFPIDRFRDWLAAVGTLEYQWDLSYEVYASLFVDCGRVWSGWDDLSLHDLRTGFGIALDAHTKGFSQVRVSMASSDNGDIFFNLYFEPVFAVRPRVERR